LIYFITQCFFKELFLFNFSFYSFIFLLSYYLFLTIKKDNISICYSVFKEQILKESFLQKQTETHVRFVFLSP